MNSNPFGPQGAYAQQPPLPPGPPPPQPAQPDPNAFWAAISAEQHAAAARAAAGVPQIAQYNAQWAAQPTAQPTAEQSALYANYGYGARWQGQAAQQAAQQPQVVHHFQPAVPMPQGYVAYPGQPAYPQQYMAQQQPPQQFIPPPLPQQPRNQHQQPPAKRQRFDGPKPPQVQGMYVQGNQPSQSQAMQMQMQMQQQQQMPGHGPARGGPTGPRAGNDRGRGGRGGGGASMNMTNGNRGGSMPRGGGSGRGSFNQNTNNAGRGGQQPMRGGRGNFTPRGGSSFSGNDGGGRGGRGSLRGSHGRGGGSLRGGSSSGSFTAPNGRKDENRRTLTDFKIVGLEIRELGWTWGALPVPKDDSDGDVKREPKNEDEATPVPDDDSEGDADGALPGGPPSRIRLYFHTPVSADDYHPISHSTAPPPPTDSRKGKRKKLADDDGDLEEGRAAPPPPQMRNAAAEVEGSASPADWLMAAIVSDDGNVSVDMEDGTMSPSTASVDLPATEEDTRSEMFTPQPESQSQAQTEPDTDDSHPEPPVPEVAPPPPAPSPPPTEEETVPPAPVDEETSAAPDAAKNITQAAEETAHAPAPEDTATEPPHSPAPTLALTIVSEPLELLQDALSPVQTQPSSQSQPSSVTSTTVVPEEESVPIIGPQAEPPLSPTSTVLDRDSPSKMSPQKTRTPSPNRMSISYATGSRRLVVDAEVVQSLKVFRQEGRVEVVINIVKEEDGEGLNGIWLEGLSESTKYLPLDSLSNSWETDVTSPPFATLVLPTTLTLVVHLDTNKPLSEPKWVKSGDVQEWLKSLFGRMFWVAGDAAAVGWEKKIEVADPDPPPTIYTILEQWAANYNDRHSFLKTHILGHKNESDHILEILLRLVRGERATAFAGSTPAISAPSLSGPLLSAMQNSTYGAQQTHVSLAVLAITKMMLDFAKKANEDDEEKARKVVDEAIADIVRCLPAHLLFKSLDGIFKEWKGEGKKGRG